MKAITAILIFLHLPSICHADNPLEDLVKVCKDLYKQLVRLDYPEPIHKYFTEPSERAFMKKAYHVIFDQAEKTGLKEQYQNIIRANPISELFESFISAEHLVMVAYQQRYYGNENPFKFNDDGSTKNDGNDPVLGLYLTYQDTKITITRYSHFNQLLQAFAEAKPDFGMTSEEQNMLAKRLFSVQEELEKALQIAKSNLSSDELISKTKKCESLYKRLVNICYLEPIGDFFNAALEREYVEEDYKKLFDVALTTGLQQQYLHLITGAISKDLLKSFFSAPHLVVIAWMQRIFGKEEPFRYEKNNYKIGKLNNPLLDVYVTAELKHINITHYSLFNALIKFFITSKNQLATNEHIAYRNNILDHLKEDLEKAIRIAEILSLLEI